MVVAMGEDAPPSMRGGGWWDRGCKILAGSCSAHGALADKQTCTSTWVRPRTWWRTLSGSRWRGRSNISYM